MTRKQAEARVVYHCNACLDTGYLESIGDRRRITFPCYYCKPLPTEAALARKEKK